MKTLKVSISGLRGIVGQSFTPQVIVHYTLGFARLVGPGRIVVARDTRPSGRLIQQLVSATLQAAGCQVIEIGVTPTPTALGEVLAQKAKGGIIVTASHNPAPWNGLKLVSRRGTFLTPQEFKKLQKWVKASTQQPPLKLASWNQLQAPEVDSGAIDRHIQRILKAVRVSAIRKRRFKVVVDSCNGAGSVAAPRLLRALGCRVTEVYTKPSGVFPRGAEPTPSNLKKLCLTVRRSHAAIGFAQDPDADRLSLVDEQGTPLSEELTLAIATQHRLSQKKGPVVVNLSTSRMVEEVAMDRGVSFQRTPVGEIHVVERMRRIGAIIGGEGNGGVIDPRVTWGRDSLVGMALILEAMAKGKCSLSQLAAPLDRWVMVKHKFVVSPARLKQILHKLVQRFRRERITQGDGIRIDLPGGWFHVRGSNTEPVVRVMAEARSKRDAQRLAKSISIK